jgi:Ca2+-binding EF-hand superfamily protein
VINILDEDLEQYITRQEFYDAIEAYNISGEKHKSINGEPYMAFEIRVLIKLTAIMRERDLSPLEVFNSCDVGGDGKVDIKELANFIEGISRDFKQKEAFAMMRFLDVDNNGTIDKDEFQKQLKKVDKYYESY